MSHKFRRECFHVQNSALDLGTVFVNGTVQGLLSSCPLPSSPFDDTVPPSIARLFTRLDRPSTGHYRPCAECSRSIPVPGRKPGRHDRVRRRARERRIFWSSPWRARYTRSAFFSRSTGTSWSSIPAVPPPSPVLLPAGFYVALPQYRYSSACTDSR